ncbi:MAG: hypothetical protein INQ03_00930 [Candidatus Heimdallarchaeota archaeon]|nr:hypothetical protein [Candidatus Heimdallarchaeota archaeon]
MDRYNEFGTVIAVDLDNFKICTQVMGWNSYTSNPITRLLTDVLEDFIRKFYALELIGIDRSKGTEEAILVVFQETETILQDLRIIIKSLDQLANKLAAPTSLSIGVATGQINEIKILENRKKSTLFRDPIRAMALKALKKAKKGGGNQIIIF